MICNPLYGNTKLVGIVFTCFFVCCLQYIFLCLPFVFHLFLFVSTVIQPCYSTILGRCRLGIIEHVARMSDFTPATQIFRNLLPSQGRCPTLRSSPCSLNPARGMGIAVSSAASSGGAQSPNAFLDKSYTCRGIKTQKTF